MDDIKVSVCMVTYNHERYIAQAVESVLEQKTKFSVELVVGEDCSTDNTAGLLRQLAARHPDKIRLRLAECNQGARVNFLGTFFACRGQYIALLEGDDFWTCPAKLQMQADALDARPDWSMCFHPTNCVYEDGMQGPASYPDWKNPEATLVDLLAENFIPTSAVMFRNRLFAEFPPWFMDLKLGDWPLHILNAAHGNIGYLPDMMSSYRIHHNGMWSSKTSEERLIGILEMFTAIDHHFAGKYSATIDKYRLDTVRHLMGRILWMQNDLEKAKEEHRELLALRVEHEELVKLRSEHDELNKQLGEDHKELVELRDECNQLVEELSSLRATYHRLIDDHERLEEFYDTWSRSIAYRLATAILRPFKRLSNSTKPSGRNSGEPKPPNDSGISKAA